MSSRHGTGIGQPRLNAAGKEDAPNPGCYEVLRVPKVRLLMNILPAARG